MKLRLIRIPALLILSVLPGLAQQPAEQSGAARLPAGVKAHRDLTYVTGGHERQKLDLYVPERAGAPLPVVIWIHGGGWQSGSKGNCPPLRQGFVERGYAVASIGYRLSGDAIFPAQIEDCKAAICWLRAHAKDYDLNPDRFGIWGSSAGGHLVALLGTSAGVKEFEVGAHLDVPSRVQAVCDYFGPTDLLQMDEHALPNSHFKHDVPSSPESRLIGGPIQENQDKAARANPITCVTADDPPFLIVHGDADPLVPPHQSELLYEALKKTGVNVRLHIIKGAGDGQGFGGREIDEMVNSFFDRCLKGTPSSTAATGATRTESVASNQPAVPSEAQGQNQPTSGQRFTFKQIRAREDANGDGRVPREEFKGPPPLFDRLDRNHDGVLTKEDFDDADKKPAGKNKRAGSVAPAAGGLS